MVSVVSRNVRGPKTLFLPNDFKFHIHTVGYNQGSNLNAKLLSIFMKHDCITLSSRTGNKYFSCGEGEEPYILFSNENKIVGISSMDNRKLTEYDLEKDAQLATSNIDRLLKNFSNSGDKFRGITKNFLINPEFLKFAYFQIKNKAGNTTKGISEETLDGISNEWFVQKAQEILSGSYQFKGSRRVKINKKTLTTK